MAIEAAGREASARLTPRQILTLIEGIAVGWTLTTAEFLRNGDTESHDRAAQRANVADGVRRAGSFSAATSSPGCGPPGSR